MIIYIVSGRTESGDEFSYAFDFKPTDAQVDAVICSDMEEEYREIGFTNWSLRKVTLIQRTDVTEAKLDRLRSCYKGLNG